jgi:hypothetical protein
LYFYFQELSPASAISQSKIVWKITTNSWVVLTSVANDSKSIVSAPITKMELPTRKLFAKFVSGKSSCALFVNDQSH